MSEEKEKKSTGEEKDTESVDLIKELGLLSTGSTFKSDFQYINIIGSIEGHTALPTDNKTTKYEHLICLLYTSHRIVSQLRNILDMQDAYIYVIDKNNYKILYLNQKTKLLDASAKPGMFCYEAFFGRTLPCVSCPLLHEEVKEVYNPKYEVWTRVHIEPFQWEKEDAYLISCYDITAYMKD